MNVSHSLIAAAVGGILLGCAGSKDAAPAAAAPTSAATREAKPGEKHACRGLNDCAHQGGCKTDHNDCKGQNDCRSQGGCHG
ncbi:MAG TPA: hypothetical protein VH142_11580 [Polyangiaceae bacterium]|jgi:hypothetical protein|nr:hypothetical protein [Polyangiaceae bacterium]